MFTYEAAGRNRTRKRPLQEALRTDLSKLATRFTEEWNSASPSSSGTSPEHKDEVLIAPFQAFLCIFQEENIALLHTQGLPPRSDPEGFAQIVYSACLQVALQDLTNLPQAAFGIFSLYALYESSVLPRAPTSWHQWLSMGLIHPDNPKLSYRRRFRPRIRIHRRLFVLLQQLQQISLGLVGNKTKEGRLAADLVSVLKRLEFDWSEYSGPRGVEALAVGILDDCFITPALPISEGIDGEGDGPEEVTVGKALLDVLKDYHGSLQAIEISSTTKQAQNVQTALGALKGERSWTDQLSILVNPGYIPFEEPWVVEDDPHKTIEVPARVDNGTERVTSSDEVVLPTSYRLRIPKQTSESVERGIMTAIGELLKRGEHLLLPKGKEAHVAIATKKSTLGNNFLTLQDEAEVHFDSDMSDVSEDDDGIQDVLDEVGDIEDSDDDEDGDGHQSAAGLQALNLLLKQAKPAAKKKKRAPKKNKETVVRDDIQSVADSSIGREALTSLLDRVNSKPPSSRKRKKDDVSIADSSAGRHALSTLLEQVKKAPRTSAIRKTKTTRITKKTPVAARRWKAAVDEEVSIAASSVGRNALSSLLEQANGNEATGRAATEDHVSVADSSAGRNALSNLLQQAAPTQRSSTRQTKKKATTKGAPVSQKRVVNGEEASIAASNVGGKALSSLLQQTNEADASITETSVGGNALSSLLKQVSATNNAPGRAAGEDHASVADSSIGRNALSDLLEQAAAPTRRRTSARQTAKKTSPKCAPVAKKRTAVEIDNDEASIAASNIGGYALASLLNQATEPPEATRQDEGDEASIAASSVGRKALSSLLSSAKGNDNETGS
jgi:hypothetical protein